MALQRPDPTRARRLVEPAAKRQKMQPLPSVEPAPLIRDPELDAMRAADRARDEELHPLSERNKRRWKMYVLGAMVFFPMVTYVFTSAGFGALWFQLLVAIGYGTFLALTRPSGLAAALATVLAGTLAQVVAGVPKNHFSGLLFVLALFIYAAAGLVLGITERAKWMNGE